MAEKGNLVWVLLSCLWFVDIQDIDSFLIDELFPSLFAFIFFHMHSIIVFSQQLIPMTDLAKTCCQEICNLTLISVIQSIASHFSSASLGQSSKLSFILLSWMPFFSHLPFTLRAQNRLTTQFKLQARKSISPKQWTPYYSSSRQEEISHSLDTFSGEKGVRT